MIVPIKAPICMYAPRPLNSCVQSQASATRNTKPAADRPASLAPSRDLHSTS